MFKTPTDPYTRTNIKFKNNDLLLVDFYAQLPHKNNSKSKPNTDESESKSKSSYSQKRFKTPKTNKKFTSKSELSHHNIQNPHPKHHKKERKRKRKKKKRITHKAIIIDGVDVLLLGDHVAEATASRVLEGNARGFGTENPVDIVAIVELIVEALGDLDDPTGVTVLNNDEMVWLEERPPHLEEVQVSDRGDHDVKFILQQRSRSD